MPGFPLALRLGNPALQPRGCLSLSISERGSDGTTATLRIAGTLALSVDERGSDGATATVRIN